MAKRKNDPTSGNDYIEQLNWRANRSTNRFTSKDPFEPKWKYRIIPPKDLIATTLWRLIFILLLIGIVGFGFYELYQKYVTRNSPYSLAIFVAFSILVIIISLAMFDSKKRP